MKKLAIAAQAGFTRAAHALQRHPRHLTAALAALMLGAGGGAFAVASIGPDPADLPVREVMEIVQPLALQAQSEALDFHTFSLYTTETLRHTDTVETLFARLGINDPAAAAWLRRDASLRRLFTAGRTVTAEATDSRALVRLTMRWVADESGTFKRLVVERGAGGELAARIDTAPLVASTRLGSGTIRSSLWAAVDEANIPDDVTIQLVEIFSGQIDFHRSLRVGDRFHVVYEVLEADGETLRTGRVISTEFVNAGRVLDAMWFVQPGQRGGYFDFSGRSLERMYLASPMQVTRVTSGFAMRFHPIHHTWRRHTGVDYGAPSGAPVRSIGDGRVEYVGWKGGYGNVVQVDHGRGESTLYAHLSRMDVRRGQLVQRGERIGAVGATGWATGPHLHFEFLRNGVHKDPLEVARQSQAAIELSAEARPAFERQAAVLRTQLAAAAGVRLVASAR